jgi:hypothetical protein
MTERTREEVVRELVALAAPVAQLTSELAGWPWDSDPLVTLTIQDATSVLTRCLGGDVSLAELLAWAGALEARDDVALEAAWRVDLRQLQFELSTPELFQPVTVEVVRTWLDRLRKTQTVPATSGGSALADESTMIWGDCYDGYDGPSIILILRSVKAAEWLEHFLQNLSPAPERTSLSGQREVDMGTRGDLSFVRVEQGKPTQLRRQGTPEPPSYVWSINPDGIESLLGLIEPFREGHTGHQYLSDVGEADAELELTYGEQHRVPPGVPDWVAEGGEQFVANHDERH